MKRRLLLLLPSILFILFSNQAKAQLEKVAAHYAQIEAQSKKQGQTIQFVQADSNWVKDFSRLSQIVLVRHGEPALYKKGWRKRREAMQFIKDYDSVGVYEPAFKPVKLFEDELKVIHTSNVSRAVSTAEQVLSQHELFQPDSLFREFERKIFSFPNLKLPLKFYLTGSRICWLMGLNDKGIESKRKAKQRAQKAVEVLVTDAKENGKSLLVAHGFLNRYLEKYLKKQGWQTVYDGGHGYLSQKMLVKYQD